MDRRVIVVGAGLGGLSASIRLARAGFDVTVVEQRRFAGGKAGSVETGGYRFDTGPSLMTMPEVFSELFALAGKEMERELPLVRLSPICSYFYPDGMRLRSWGEEERFAEEVGSRSTDDPGTLRRYLAYSRRIYDAVGELFLRMSLHEGSTYASGTFRRALAGLGRIDAMRSMHDANAAFFRDPRIVQLFDRYATYSGSNPYRAPATLNIIPHVEYGLGAFAPRDGIVAIPRALERLARESGVRFLFGTRVEEILHRRGEVVGVRAAGADMEAPVVVSNADVLSTYRGLLREPGALLARRYDRLEPSSSGLVFCFGIDRSFPELLVHNVFFSSDYRREFDQIFSGRMPEDPTIYVNISSKVTPSDAPGGGENWFVLLNAPHAAGQDWEAETRRCRETAIARISRELGVDVREHMRAEWTLSPPEIEAQTGSTYGSLYGISSNTRLAAFLRHPNRSRRYRGLYFCGGSAHPGGGMPLALLSGKITAELVERQEGRPAPRKRSAFALPPTIPGREAVARRRDRWLALAIALLYVVGFAGHLIPATRPLMLSLTPGFLAFLGLFVAARALRRSRRGLVWALCTYAVTFCLEAVGVATGAVFGPYAYGTVLGPMALDVPLVIGFNWLLVVLGSGDAARLLRIGRAVGRRSADPEDLCPICVGAASGILCVLVDIPLEMVAVRLGYWKWYTPVVPIQNYLVWFITAALSSFALEILGHRVRSRLPAAYFLIQLVFFAILATVL